MQHWLTYQKFNARLFEERYMAWLQGVAGENDLSVGWYEGELWFFDNYIITLAEKLSACGVFGVSSFECLNYAQANRAEWEQKGCDIVSLMLEHCWSKYSPQRSKNAEVEEEEIQFDTPSYCHTLGRSWPPFEVQRVVNFLVNHHIWPPLYWSRETHRPAYCHLELYHDTAMRIPPGIVVL
jgi:hypothetical protein